MGHVGHREVFQFWGKSTIQASIMISQQGAINWAFKFSTYYILLFFWLQDVPFPLCHHLVRGAHSGQVSVQVYGVILASPHHYPSYSPILAHHYTSLHFPIAPQVKKVSMYNVLQNGPVCVSAKHATYGTLCILMMNQAPQVLRQASESHLSLTLNTSFLTPNSKDLGSNVHREIGPNWVSAQRANYQPLGVSMVNLFM